MPVPYIILKLMDILKCHKKETKLAKWQIERVVDDFLEKGYLTKEERENLDFYTIDEEINMLLINSIYFYGDEEENIVLSDSVSSEAFESLIDDEKKVNDKDMIDRVDKYFSSNSIHLLELFNIKYEKELFNRLCNLQDEIEEEYDIFAQAEMDKEVLDDGLMHQAKLMTTKRNMAYNFMKENLSLQEYEDISSYSKYLTSINNYCELSLKIKNEKLHNFIINDPFHRALFFIDDNEEFNLRDKLSIHAFNFPEERSKETFYYYVLDVIDRKVNTPGNEMLLGDLVNAKYRLMCSVDTIYGNFILKGYKSNNNRFIPDYSFIKNEIYYFIDELLLYSDYEMTDVSTLNDYNNTIKSILIEAYYDLTGDEEIINRIKSNPNYGKEHFITYLLENILNRPKGKIKRKGDD